MPKPISRLCTPTLGEKYVMLSTSVPLLTGSLPPNRMFAFGEFAGSASTDPLLNETFPSAWMLVSPSGPAMVKMWMP